ncbi:hypothetical protein DGG96_12890 [Legionella qingyii]|uniref:Uncharacterized protein n=1 Tax=Legionella qingyii TaxID=2184757 RepID=A0A317U2U8_9GAMM|nr:hypothetical protein [Legionella qingyii]PWY55076.1 hypothetical protein DGG96_12890 [Legionella qingyii]RUR25499.1 hypothetical protein ELY20_03320 [Legionella qingyii]RUR28391.1 hypothetical protein ELY16_02690 [Legionella qingyii]
MAIRYLSFEFDECLFNHKYIQESDLGLAKHLGDAILIHNRAYLDQLKIENTAFDTVVVLIGSNRQSYEYDYSNMGYGNKFKGSCCPAIQTVCADLNVTFDPFLLADVTGNLPYGTSYKLIMQEIADNTYLKNPQQNHATCTMDETKRTLLFAQMQKAAADHPNEEIIFDFVDGRYDILVCYLYKYFTKHPHMIPKNVSLRLHLYGGAKVALMASIQGTGEPYLNYPEHVKYMLGHLWDLDKFAESMKLFSIEHIDNILENFYKLEEQATALESAIQKGEYITKCTESIDNIEELATEKESDIDTYDFSVTSDESSDEDSDLAFLEDNGPEKEVDAGKQTLATETSTIHPRPEAEPANQQGNLGRNQHVFHKPVAVNRVNRSPMALPDDTFCSASSSCLIS